VHDSRVQYAKWVVTSRKRRTIETYKVTTDYTDGKTYMARWIAPLPMTFSFISAAAIHIMLSVQRKYDLLLIG